MQGAQRPAPGFVPIEGRRRMEEPAGAVNAAGASC